MQWSVCPYKINHLLKLINHRIIQADKHFQYLLSTIGDAQIPKKRKIRRKNVQMTEMAVQTSPGLKLNR